MNAVAKIDTDVAFLKLDLGCGKAKKEGFTGVDAIKFDGVDVVCNLGVDTWPFENESVSEAHCSHTLEHLTNLNGKWERTHFFNELYRVMVVGGKCQLIIPHWCSTRYYGDPTHKEPFSEMGFYYLDRGWREKEAPHTDIQHNPNGYMCSFNCTWGYSINPAILSRNLEYQQHALTWFKEAAQDLICTMVKA